MRWRSKQGPLKPAVLRGGKSYAASDSCSPFPLLSLCLFLFQNTMHLSRLHFVTFVFLPHEVTIIIQLRSLKAKADIEEFEANYRGSDSKNKDLTDLYKKCKGTIL